MNIPKGSWRFERLLVALVATWGAALPDARAEVNAAGGQPQLKWTPHRDATGSADPGRENAGQENAGVEIAPVATPQAAAAPPRLRSVPGTGVSSVQLPDGVPDMESMRGVASAPMGPRPRTALPTQFRQPPSRPTADGLVGIDIFRTPTRGPGRPILGDERPEQAARASERDRVQRLGGGLAPRFADAQRPERLAAGIDAIPSVMRRVPDPTAPADAAGPGAGAEPEVIAAPPARADGSLSGGPMPGGIEFAEPFDPAMMDAPDELMLGAYPPTMHVESFYDDPYACEDDDLLWHPSGRICAWLRRFGRPYYGWRWYRDFTVGAGAIAFTNPTDLGLNGNFGFNEYVNQGMPFWNAFGVGWQIGVRGTQSNFQSSSLQFPGGTLQRTGRDQVFVTTGFFTRAFEGRGLQGGAVYDYLHDNWFDGTDVAQIRYELSYVWGYHEFGFWGASNIGNQASILSPVRQTPGETSTLDLYTAFYRLQFGDANEWKVWGGGTAYGDGIIGSMVRAPMSRSWGLEGFCTYVIPGKSQTIDIDGAGTTYTFSPAAWNVGVNVVFYPAGRSRRSLASPYRPLFDVADNGSLIRRLGPATP